MLLEKYEVCCDLKHGFDWSKWMTGSSAERLGLLPAGQEHVLQQEDGKARFTKVVTDISRAFALCAAHDEAIRLRDDIAFFQAVRSALVKPSGERKTQEDLDHAIRQLVSKAINEPFDERPVLHNNSLMGLPSWWIMEIGRPEGWTYCKSCSIPST